MGLSFQSWESVFHCKSGEDAHTGIADRTQFLAGRGALCREHLLLRYASPNAPPPRKASPPNMHTDRPRIACWSVRVRDTASVADSANPDDNRRPMARFGI
jgi:hypothetical protein